MRPTTSAPPRDPADPKPTLNDPNSATPASGVSVPRLYFLRLGYLVIAVGIAVTKWPLLINHDRPWPLMEGVETCMLVALSLLWFLGIRYPLQMLPVLLFEIAWKLIWTIAVVLPLWTSDQLDPATLSVFYACLVVVIPIAVIPWRYVTTHYVTKRGDQWRSSPRQTEVSRPTDVTTTVRQGS